MRFDTCHRSGDHRAPLRPVTALAATLVLGCFAAPMTRVAGEEAWLTLPGAEGKPGSGKQVVLVAGDEEYRSEEALPQLAQILAKRHGFRCTVLFPIDPETGTINPENVSNIPGLEHLRDADLMIIATRFRNLADEQMRFIVEYVESGKPVLGMRTATHAFNIPAGAKYGRYSWRSDAEGYEGGFGRQVLGETWIAHHGRHKHESTRGIVADDEHPIVRGIGDGEIWGPTDVYRVRLPLPGDSHVIVHGAILRGMSPDDPAVDDERNDPMMPIAWTRTHNDGRVFTTTMGAATDLLSSGVRRMLVNAVYWCVGLEDEIRADADVATVGDFRPTAYGFGDFVPGRKPSDYR